MRRLSCVRRRDFRHQSMRRCALPSRERVAIAMALRAYVPHAELAGVARVVNQVALGSGPVAFTVSAFDRGGSPFWSVHFSFLFPVDRRKAF